MRDDRLTRAAITYTRLVEYDDEFAAAALTEHRSCLEAFGIKRPTVAELRDAWRELVLAARDADENRPPLRSLT